MITGSGPEPPPPPEAVTVAMPPLAVAVTLVLKFIEVIPVPTEVPLFSISIKICHNKKKMAIFIVVLLDYFTFWLKTTIFLE